MSDMPSRFMSKIALSSSATISELRRHGALNANEYNMHKILWNIMSYSPTQQRDFIFRCDYSRDGLPEFTVVSKVAPQRSLGIWKIQTKEYAPKLQANDRLQFALRCNPVKTPYERNRESEGKKQLRVDVVGLAKKDAWEKGLHVSQQEIIAAESLAWLSARGERNGFILNGSSLIAEKYNVAEHPKDRQKTLSMLDVSGVVRITDPEKFMNMLFNGLGHAKAWGCGLMLVKRG